MIIKEIFNGIKCYFKANRVVSKYKLWPYLTLPGILSIGYVVLLIIMGLLYFHDLSVFITSNILPDFLQGGFMRAVVAILLWLFLLVIGFISYKEIALIFFAPVLGYLSERVEKLILNEDPAPFNLKKMFMDLIRSLKLSLRNLAIMLTLTISSWLIGFIPVIGAFTSPFLILLVQSYYSGIGLADYTLERKKYSVKESILFAHNNRGRITGVGLGFMLLFLIPVIGWFTAPGYGAIAGTIAALEKINDKDIRLKNI